MDGSDLQKVELEGFGDGEYARVLTVDAQNQFRLLTQKSDYNEKIGEDTQYYDIHTLNEKESMIDTIELKKENAKFEDEDFSFYSNRTVFHDGRLYAAVYSKIYTFDEKGEAGREMES